VTNTGQLARLRGRPFSGIRIAGRYPPEQAPNLIVGRPDGVKSVIACDVDRQRKARDADAGPPFSAIMAAS
jgi:hypothetical protein